MIDNDNNNLKKYKSKQWRYTRAFILARDKYICQYFKRFGVTKNADVVHHIYPSNDYPSLFFNVNNLISLSNEAHEKMHNRKTGEISQDGRKLQQKFKNKIFKK